MLKLYFYFLLIFLKIHSFEKKDEVKKFEEYPELTIYVSCFLLPFVVLKIFSEN